MSHVTTYQHVITNVPLFCEVCEELGHKVTQGESINVRLFGSQAVRDAQASIQFTDWKYAVAINKKGELLYDHFGSKPGSMDYLHNAMQSYNQQAIIAEIPMDMVESYAVEHLENAVDEWESYARIASTQSNTQLLSRTNYLDWWSLLEDVKTEVETVRKMK